MLLEREGFLLPTLLAEMVGAAYVDQAPGPAAVT